MRNKALWQDPMYLETSALVLAFIFLICIFLFSFRNKNKHTLAAWASLKSWLFVGPLLLITFGIKWPAPLICLCLVGIYASKKFFQMIGMYHRSWFVVTCYLFIGFLGWAIHTGSETLFNISPMIFLGTISLIPLIRNSSKHMVQYMALSLMAFIFFGWSFMHLGRIFEFEKGPFIVLYIYILSEISENTCLGVSRFFGKNKFFQNVTSRFSLEGILAATFMSLFFAWAIRHLLPVRTEPYWIMSGLVVTYAGQLGALLLSTIRRDLGIKATGVFIIGRGDIIDRMDKLIFVGPVFYYLYIFMERIMNA